MHSPLRRGGLLVPVTSLRQKNDLGIGDVGHLRALLPWAAQHEIGFLQLLPLNECGRDFSPYNAISSLALDPLLIDLSDLPFLTPTQLAKGRQRLGPTPLESPRIQAAQVRQLKNALLRTAYQQWQDHPPTGPYSEGNHRTFLTHEESWLHDYATFRVLMDLEGGSEEWDLWSINYRTPETARQWVSQHHLSERDYYSWLQFIAYTQWRALSAQASTLGVKLMGDIPIGVSFHSADVFFHRDEFELNWSGGAPPERVFKDDPFAVKWGQNWGVPLYNWKKMAESDYSWWRQRIEKLTEVFQIFRIDHILGFYRIFSFPWRAKRNAEFLPLSPDQARARTGGELPRFRPRDDSSEKNAQLNTRDAETYLRAIQEAAGSAEVVGEDLGAVPPYVRPSLTHLGIAGFKILHWEVEPGPDGQEHPIDPRTYPPLSFATYATHDHPPMAAMWEDFRANLTSPHPDHRAGAHWNLRVLSELAGHPVPPDGDYPAYHDRLHWDLLRALFQSGSSLAAIMITDLYQLPTRFNTPGTVSKANWRVRLPFHVEDMTSDPTHLQAAQKLRQILLESDRRAWSLDNVSPLPSPNLPKAPIPATSKA